MRSFCVIIILGLIGCIRSKSNEDIILVYEVDNILVHYNGDKKYIKVPFANIEPLNDLQPAFCVDSTNSSIFIYVPHFGIKKYDLSSKKLLHENPLSYKYQKMNHTYKLNLINEHVVLSSYLHILVYNKELEIEASLRDTIEKNICPELALHYFDKEFIGDTILFKAMFIEENDFTVNKRYKRIYKDFEFILSPYKVACNNCDTCNKRNVLTKPEMDELLKNPY
jgi:hypothetical protein